MHVINQNEAIIIKKKEKKKHLVYWPVCIGDLCINNKQKYRTLKYNAMK